MTEGLSQLLHFTNETSEAQSSRLVAEPKLEPKSIGYIIRGNLIPLIAPGAPMSMNKPVMFID